MDANSVYWANQEMPGGNGAPNIPGSIRKVSRDGGPITVIASQTANGLALGGTDLYWTGADGTVVRAPTAGGAIATLASGLGGTWSIAALGSSVFWVDGQFDTVMKMSLCGGTPSTIAAPAHQSGTMGPIAVDRTSVYWTNSYHLAPIAPGTVTRVPLGGGAIETLASVPGADLGGVAVDATNVYWTADLGGGRIMKAPLGGGPVVTLAATSNPGNLAVDRANVYWTASTPGAVMKLSIDGGTPTTLYSGGDPKNLVVDDTSVYWTDYNNTAADGLVMRVTPK